MTQYFRLCNGLSDKGTLIPTQSNVYELVDLDKDYYVSLYKYNQKHKEQFEQSHSVAGITDTQTNQLLWDFDDDNFDVVRKDAIELVSRLKNHGISESEINIFFSGNKGLHIQVNLESDIMPDEFKSITRYLAEDLSSYDSSVSNPSRILRLTYTKHQESGLYKIPLTYRQLTNVSESVIRKLASKKHKIENNELRKVNLPLTLSSIPKAKVKLELVKEQELSHGLDLDYRIKPKWLSHWKYALLNGYFPPGTRNDTLMILAATYKAQGMPETVTYHALKGALELQCKRFEEEKFPKEELYNNVVKQVYSASWQGGTYSEDNFPQKLKNYLNELGLPKSDVTILEEQLIQSIDEGFKDFVGYAEEIDKHTMSFGLPVLDNKLKIRKGHLIGLLSSPGTGKTSLAVTILNNTSLLGINSFFASYDMYKNNVMQKLIQRHTGLSESRIYSYFVNKDEKKINEFKTVLEDNYKNVSFCFKSGQSIDELKNSIKLQEEKIGKTISLVVVDYLELIQTKSSDPTASSMEAAQGLREIANEGRVVLMLLQPNKMSSKPNEPIESYNSAKGSSSIAQASTAIITMHRPGLSSNFPEDDRFLGINCVKNRNGPLFAVDFAWEGSTQTISELDEAGKQELTELRALIKLRNTEKDLI